jgi:hypothetical protein
VPFEKFDCAHLIPLICHRKRSSEVRDGFAVRAHRGGTRSSHRRMPVNGGGVAGATRVVDKAGDVGVFRLE